MLRCSALILTALAPAVAWSGGRDAGAAGPRPIVRADTQPTFYEDVLPIFRQRCLMCHREPSMLEQGVPNGLYLDTYERVMRGSDYFAVVQPGEPENSMLVAAVRNGTMPPQNLGIPPLTDAQVATIVAWVEAGAAEGVAPDSTGR